MTDWTELKRLAEAATPGDWYAGNVYDKPFIACYQVIVKVEEGNYVILEGNQNFLDDARENVAFVAAANPKTILALIAENERLRKDADRFNWLLSQFGSSLADMITGDVLASDEDVVSFIDENINGD